MILEDCFYYNVVVVLCMWLCDFVNYFVNWFFFYLFFMLGFNVDDFFGKWFCGDCVVLFFLIV